jgi:hypothetical protein
MITTLAWMGFPMSFRPNSQSNQIDARSPPSAGAGANPRYLANARKAMQAVQPLVCAFPPDGIRVRNIISAMHVVV